ncbi:hypothetical protein GF366_00475 [Candidatus Peregrinibacteria bacterium]|nr:hypothetical protein [Candidatus Peregrinibacteria bacterium]
MAESLRSHLSIVPDPEEEVDPDNEVDPDKEDRKKNKNVRSISKMREIIEDAARRSLRKAKIKGGNRIEI